MEKKRERRYQRAGELRDDLMHLKQQLSFGATSRAVVTQALRKPKFAVPTTMVAITAILLGIMLYRRSARIHWAREQAIPEIIELTQKGNYTAAFALAEQAEKYIANEPRLQRLWPEMSRPVTIHTTPEGAEVYVKSYRDGVCGNMWDVLRLSGDGCPSKIQQMAGSEGKLRERGSECGVLWIQLLGTELNAEFHVVRKRQDAIEHGVGSGRHFFP
jgi:hypothetical protein